MPDIRGVVPIIPIPFKDDESIDDASLRRLVDWAASRGLGAVCLPAYGSEFYKLSEADREQVIGIAIEANAGRVPLLAQANHGSAKIAAGLAARYEKMGADLVSFAIPRLFGATEEDVLRFCGTIADAVSVPILIQDFNPGGATIGASFIAEMRRRHPNFRYAKLEEPMIVDKLVAIRDAIGDDVGVLEGWGGYYMLEAIPKGVIGIMPGLAYADLLDLIFQARADGQDERAYDLFASALPMIAFTLQDMELFLQIEKRMLVRRGLQATPCMRSITLTPSAETLAHAEYLTDNLFRVMEREGLQPVVGAD